MDCKYFRSGLFNQLNNANVKANSKKTQEKKSVLGEANSLGRFTKFGQRSSANILNYSVGRLQYFGSGSIFYGSDPNQNITLM